MTVSEYNHVWYPLYTNSNVFISKLDDALTKAGPEAVKQAKCLGWTPEMQEYILHAIEVYQASIRKQVNEKRIYLCGKKNQNLQPASVPNICPELMLIEEKIAPNSLDSQMYLGKDMQIQKGE